jgi:hypothetical protein
VIAQLVDKSATADLRATKMLLDILKDIEGQAGTAPAPKPARFTSADEEVIENLFTRLRRAGAHPPYRISQRVDLRHQQIRPAVGNGS